MLTTDYKSTPQAKNLLAHLHSINPDFDIDIIYPLINNNKIIT